MPATPTVSYLLAQVERVSVFAIEWYPMPGLPSLSRFQT